MTGIGTWDDFHPLWDVCRRDDPDGACDLCHGHAACGRGHGECIFGEGKKKVLGVVDLEGIAIGRIGMSRGDFPAMTPGEFESASRAAILIRPHIKRGIPEDKLIPLSCDKRHEPEREQTAEERARSEARLARFRARL